VDLALKVYGLTGRHGDRERYALVANEDGRPGDELAHLVLALAAERAVQRVFRITAANLAHFRGSSR
jgi:hypothetical protein